MSYIILNLRCDVPSIDHLNNHGNSVEPNLSHLEIRRHEHFKNLRDSSRIHCCYARCHRSYEYKAQSTNGEFRQPYAVLLNGGDTND